MLYETTNPEASATEKDDIRLNMGGDCQETQVEEHFSAISNIAIQDASCLCIHCMETGSVCRDATGTLPGI